MHWHSAFGNSLHLPVCEKPQTKFEFLLSAHRSPSRLAPSRVAALCRRECESARVGAAWAFFLFFFFFFFFFPDLTEHAPLPRSASRCEICAEETQKKRKKKEKKSLFFPFPCRFPRLWRRTRVSRLRLWRRGAVVLCAPCCGAAAEATFRFSNRLVIKIFFFFFFSHRVFFPFPS
jgi:hypothetical protein